MHDVGWLATPLRLEVKTGYTLVHTQYVQVSSAAKGLCRNIQINQKGVKKTSWGKTAINLGSVRRCTGNLVPA